MEYINHGDWVAYQPDDHPVIVLGAMSVQFCKRTADNRDWYDYQQKQLLANKLSIKFTLFHATDDQWAVMSTATDASLLFPAKCKLIEIAGYSGPHEELRGQYFDLETGEFTKPPPPPPATISFKQ